MVFSFSDEEHKNKTLRNDMKKDKVQTQLSTVNKKDKKKCLKKVKGSANERKGKLRLLSANAEFQTKQTKHICFIGKVKSTFRVFINIYKVCFVDISFTLGLF